MLQSIISINNLYIPHKCANGVSQISLFEIMRTFVKQRDNSIKYSRDYARNTYSRIRTNLRKDYKLTSVEVVDLIRNQQLLNICFNGEVCIPDTTLVKNIILPINHDILLTLLIDRLGNN